MEEQRQRSPYEILGVPEGASQAVIKKAYRKLAREYHPDKTGGDKAKEEEFKKIQATYETICGKNAEPIDVDHLKQLFQGEINFWNNRKEKILALSFFTPEDISKLKNCIRQSIGESDELNEQLLKKIQDAESESKPGIWLWVKIEFDRKEVDRLEQFLVKDEILSKKLEKNDHGFYKTSGFHLKEAEKLLDSTQESDFVVFKNILRLIHHNEKFQLLSFYDFIEESVLGKNKKRRPLLPRDEEGFIWLPGSVWLFFKYTWLVDYYLKSVDGEFSNFFEKEGNNNPENRSY